MKSNITLSSWQSTINNTKRCAPSMFQSLLAFTILSIFWLHYICSKVYLLTFTKNADFKKKLMLNWMLNRSLSLNAFQLLSTPCLSSSYILCSSCFMHLVIIASLTWLSLSFKIASRPLPKLSSSWLMTLCFLGTCATFTLTRSS